jgi:hypothetical protein
MEQLDVLGFYFKKFDILSSKVIKSLTNQIVEGSDNMTFQKNIPKDIARLKIFLKLEKLSAQEIEALVTLFLQK